MTPAEDDSWHDAPGSTPAERARKVAEKTLQRLRKLNELYPSPELDEAIRKLEAWRDEHFRAE